MSLFARKVEKRTTNLTDLIGQLFGDSVSSTYWDRFPIETTSGVFVTPRTALHNPTVWRARQLIAGRVSSLPVDVYEKDAAGVSVEVLPPPLITAPSGEVTARAWRAAALESLIFDGNIVGQVAATDGMGRPQQVELVDMAYVRVLRNPQTSVWEWWLYGRPVPSDRVWHVAMDPPPGCILGRSLIEHAAEVIGTGLASQQYAAGFFGDGAHPTMVIKNTAMEINQAQATAIANRVIEVLTAGRRPLVVGKGYEVEPWQSSPADAMLVDVWASNITNLCNYFGLPAEMLGGKTSSSMTYTNLEARGLDLLKYCIEIWAAPLEEKWTLSLPAPQFARFNYDALLRTETATRYAAHATAIRSGFATPNERRELEDMEPVDGGDDLLWPPYRAFPVNDDESAPVAAAPVTPAE